MSVLPTDNEVEDICAEARELAQVVHATLRSTGVQPFIAVLACLYAAGAISIMSRSEDTTYEDCKRLVLEGADLVMDELIHKAKLTNL